MPARKNTRPHPPCHLIPPAEMFDRFLPGTLVLHADKPFEQRVAIAWQRLMGQFHEDEQPRVRELLVEILAGKTTTITPRAEP